MTSNQIVLTDTCTFIMLIQLAPDMLKEERFACRITQDIHNEFFKTKKFKDKYPWRDTLKKYIKNVYYDSVFEKECKKELESVSFIESSSKNCDGKKYNLSHVDKRIITVAIVKEYIMCSTDKNLVLFAEVEYELKTITPLFLLNNWIEIGLIKWSDEKQKILKQWEKEPEQPESEKKRFTNLTKYQYPA